MAQQLERLPRILRKRKQQIVGAIPIRGCLINNRRYKNGTPIQKKTVFVKETVPGAQAMNGIAALIGHFEGEILADVENKLLTLGYEAENGVKIALTHYAGTKKRQITLTGPQDLVEYSIERLKQIYLTTSGGEVEWLGEGPLNG